MKKYKWTCKKSVIRHGSRDIGKGKEVPSELIESMGEERVKKLIDAGKMAEGGAGELSDRDKSAARADELGLKYAWNAGVKKINDMIDAEEARLVLLAKAKDMKLDVADDATADDIDKMINAAG